jgi:hypothetical protein
VRRGILAAALGAALLVDAAAWGLTSLLKGPPKIIAQYGHIRSLTPSGSGYLLRLDPAYWLEGLTARRAAAQDGQTVDNDYYILDPDNRVLTYRVLAGTPVTVVTVHGAVTSTPISVAELAQIVKGRNPRHRPLIERSSARYLGYWVKTSIDMVKSIDQQYQP